MLWATKERSCAARASSSSAFSVWASASEAIAVEQDEVHQMQGTLHVIDGV